MSSISDAGDRDPPAPFLLQLFYRNGGFCRPDEFASNTLPPCISVYTWPRCTLSELAFELATSKPSVLPYPATGTRLSFQLVCPDLRSMSTVYNPPPRYAVKDLGSLVIGTNMHGDDPEFVEMGGSAQGAENKTLDSARFVVGDYVSCAILPPLADGSVAPASSARRDSHPAYRDSMEGRGAATSQGRVNGFTRGSARESRGMRRGGGGAGGPGIIVPPGEWRRGERLPLVPPSRPRGGLGSDGRW